MFFYLFFSFWELLFRTIGSMLMFSLSIGRLAFLISVPIFVLIISTIIVAKIAFKLTQVKSDENRSVEEIVTSRGFRFEDHEITTADGYLLHMFRVMNPHTPDNVRIRKPVLLMHGLGTHALIFLLNDEHGPMYKRLIDPHDPLYKFKKNGANNHAEDALAFELAARGYDVWLGNQRGNRFSNKHAYLDPVRDSAKYWNFSFDEIAMFDLPALIDHVLRETGQEKLSYISLSQGSTIMFALMSSQPKYNQLIRPFIAIAPVISTKHSQLICGFGKTIINWAPCFALRFPGRAYPGFLEFLIQLFFCNHSLEAFSNVIGKSLYPGKYVNPKRMSAFLAYPGIHCSRKNVAHYFQLHHNEFSRFDYGPAGNLKKYGSKEPQLYHLDRVTCNSIALIYSTDDSMAAAADVRILRSKLSVEPFDIYVIRKKKWDHNDFLLGKDCGSIVNERINLLLRAATELSSESSFSAPPSLAGSGYLTPDAGPSSSKDFAAIHEQQQDDSLLPDTFHSFPTQTKGVIREECESGSSTGSESSSPVSSSTSFELLPPLGSTVLSDHEEQKRPSTENLLDSTPSVRRRK